MRALLLLALTALPARAQPPRLFVLISVDQMRADYLERFRGELRGGLERLLKNGAVFTAARQLHVPTETGPGHAALAAGAWPSEHGIVGNEWRDPASGEELYCAADPAFGRSPRRLRAPTLGDRLKAARPDAKVLAVAGKDRAAIMLGGARADLALWVDYKEGAPATSPYYGKLPAWASAEKAAPGESSSKVPAFDGLTLRMALAGVKALGLGADDVPDLLLLSLSGMDHIGHRYGPAGPEMRAQVLSVDRHLGALFDALDRRVGPGRWAAGLSADHGIPPLPKSDAGRAAGTRYLLHGPLLKALEQAMLARLGPSPSGRWVQDFLPPNLTLDLEAAPSGPARERALAALEASLTSVPEIAESFRPGRWEGSPFACRYRRSYFPGRSGDLQVRLKEGVIFSWGDDNTSHGSVYDDDARVPLILLGPGLRPGAYPRPVSALSLAPTAARLLQIPFPNRPGRRALAEAFGETDTVAVGPGACF